MITSKEMKASWKEECGWYQNPSTKLWLKIGDGAKIGDSAEIGNRAKIGDWARIGDCAKIGGCAKIGNRAKIGGGAKIGDCAEIGNGAKIGGGANVISIRHKYIGTLVIKKESIEIRIGCEIHPVSQWELHGAKLAEKHGESLWWTQTGQHMLELLVNEAKTFNRQL